MPLDSLLEEYTGERKKTEQQAEDMSHQSQLAKKSEKFLRGLTKGTRINIVRRTKTEGGKEFLGLRFETLDESGFAASVVPLDKELEDILLRLKRYATEHAETWDLDEGLRKRLLKELGDGS